MFFDGIRFRTFGGAETFVRVPHEFLFRMHLVSLILCPCGDAAFDPSSLMLVSHQKATVDLDGDANTLARQGAVPFVEAKGTL